VVTGVIALPSGTANAFFGFGDWFDGPGWGYPGYGWGGYAPYGYAPAAPAAPAASTAE